MRIARLQVSAVLIIVLLILSFVLRILNLSSSTEFLGDQGRTMLHIYSLWNAKSIPFVGPTVLSGQYLGPAYYFLVAPFVIISKFHLASGAYAVMFYGMVGILFAGMAFRLLFPIPIAFLLTAIWALSPFAVSTSRFLWEPNLVSVFVMLYIFAVAILYKTKNYIVGSVLLGISTGILIQLHYPNLLFIALSGIIYCTMMYSKRSVFVLWVALFLAYVSAFLLILSPFVYYEITHGFENSLSVIVEFVYPSLNPIGKRQILYNFIDYSGRILSEVVHMPRVSFIGVSVFLCYLVTSILYYRSQYSIFIIMWIFLGVGAMSFYRGVVFDHYLYFLLPAVYLIFGHWAVIFSRIFWTRILVYIILGILLLTNIYLSVALVVKTPKRNDIARVLKTIQLVEHELGTEYFGFGLVSSPSFSDTHYRAGFALRGMNAMKLSGKDTVIVLVCELDRCPLQYNGSIMQIPTLCNEDHCAGEYPIVDVEKYAIFIRTTPDATILFGRKYR